MANRTLTAAAAAALILRCVLVSYASEPTVLSSPSKQVSATFAIDSQARLAFSVTRSGKTVTESSALGISVDGQDLGNGVAIGRPEGQDERYPGVGFCKKVKVRLVRLILPFVRGQL